MSDDPEVTTTMREMLADLGSADARAVRPVLMSLKQLAAGEAPAPSPEVAAGFGTRIGVREKPWASRHKGLIFSVSLLGALGAGTGTAAAVSPAFRAGADHVITTIINTIPFVPHSTSGSGSLPPGSQGTSPVDQVNTVTTPTPTPTADSQNQNDGNPGSNNGNPDSNNGGATSNNGNGKGGESAQHANPHSTSHPTPHATKTPTGKKG